MSNPRRINRDELKRMIEEGRKLVYATLYERKDYMVDISRGGALYPVRDVTDEPEQSHRRFLKVRNF
jgi:hypothetical protein